MNGPVKRAAAMLSLTPSCYVFGVDGPKFGAAYIRHLGSADDSLLNLAYSSAQPLWACVAGRELRFTQLSEIVTILFWNQCLIGNDGDHMFDAAAADGVPPAERFPLAIMVEFA